MLIKKIQGKPEKVTLPNGTTPTLRLEMRVYKFEGDEDAEELLDVYAEGVEIINQVVAHGVTYITVRKLIPVKIAL